MLAPDLHPAWQGLPDYRWRPPSRPRLRSRARSGWRDVAITFRNSAREAHHTVVDLSSFGIRAFALRCDVTDEAQRQVNDEGRRTRTRPHRHPRQQRRQLRHCRIRAPHPPPSGMTIRLQYSRTISGLARSPEMDAPQADRIETRRQNRSPNRSEDHPHGFFSAACVPGPPTRITVPQKPPCTCSLKSWPKPWLRKSPSTPSPPA